MESSEEAPTPIRAALLKHPSFAVAIAGTAVFVLVRLQDSEYYGRIGVTPGEVGRGYTETLGSSAVLVMVSVVVAIAVLLAVLLAMAAAAAVIALVFLGLQRKWRWSPPNWVQEHAALSPGVARAAGISGVSLVIAGLLVTTSASMSLLQGEHCERSSSIDLFVFGRQSNRVYLSDDDSITQRTTYFLGTGPDHAVFLLCFDGRPARTIRVKGDYNFEGL